ncbi:amino acid ABC transporter substrate-binding protein [Pseudoroseicyclus aestuarii]|uniref:General L-amino acid transport system substrate-binding protein n=1 Tax=Pseudoroseicyclus aestuarii TaxID=1795041 RepID=A0A318SS65_9RHOB|nr:amino acid ABC transporter substrate-binding protein [Pseudoroseicyclus aestuarii]PYE81206.1 general L-amino acid transport system substrate-binding protein [Pseudoroseicyclus aestuarii]
MRTKTIVLSSILGAAIAAPAVAQSTLETVKERGRLICGASQGTPGFGAPDDNGYWNGIDVSMCRAVAVAVLDDMDAVDFVPLTGQQRIPALQTGEIDMLPRTLTWTLQRDSNGIDFTTTNYYEYTGFMMPASLGIETAEDMTGASVCVQTGSTTELIVNDVSQKNGLDLNPVVFDNTSGTREAFFSGRCDALITDAGALASVRATMADNPDDYVIFPATPYASALTPAVREGDAEWRDIVNWSIQSLIAAEDFDPTQENIDAALDSEDPVIMRFVGTTPGLGQSLGLSDDFSYRIVKAMGNYDEIFERTVGMDSPLQIERGYNALYSGGGLMFPLAFQ